MHRKRILLASALVVLGAATLVLVAEEGVVAPDWKMKATIIEACSCPMFCQCYFNTEPAEHHGGHEGGGHFCRFNNAFHVNGGQYGEADLTGAKFWVAGDLGGDFSQGKMDWAALHFDPAVTPAQRDGIAAILGKVYPVEWNSFVIGEDGPMEWMATKDKAVAKMAGGKMGEVVLHRMQGMTDEPVVIHNLRYWGLPQNDGFVMMPNEVEAYRVGDQAFEFRGTNGFMITFDITSKDAGGAKKGY